MMTMKEDYYLNHTFMSTISNDVFIIMKAVLEEAPSGRPVVFYETYHPDEDKTAGVYDFMLETFIDNKVVERIS